MNIAVFGMGYVGLSLGVLLACRHHVTAVDLLPERVACINARKSPLRDVYIERFLAEETPDLCATLDPTCACREADLVIIAVPTDHDPQRLAFDTSAVETVIREVAACNPRATMVIKSTVPVGFTARMRAACAQAGHKAPLLFSPEFLRESRALYDNLYPSRIIVGADLTDPASIAAARGFADLLAEGAFKGKPAAALPAGERVDETPVDIRIMGTREAEAVKLFANTYLALRVAYFNELDAYAEERGLDAAQIIAGVCLDPRIGDHYNNPSFGYGGYCLPKDTKQLLAEFAATPQHLIGAVVASNRTRKDVIADRILSRVATVSDPVIGIYRLSMKTDSDNFRQSAVRGVMRRLRTRGARILVYEPTLADGTVVDGCPVVNDMARFKSLSHLIVANRCHAELDDVRDRVYTRDLFFRD